MRAACTRNGGVGWEGGTWQRRVGMFGIRRDSGSSGFAVTGWWRPVHLGDLGNGGREVWRDRRRSPVTRRLLYRHRCGVCPRALSIGPDDGPLSPLARILGAAAGWFGTPDEADLGRSGENAHRSSVDCAQKFGKAAAY